MRRWMAAITTPGQLLAMLITPTQMSRFEHTLCKNIFQASPCTWSGTTVPWVRLSGIVELRTNVVSDWAKSTSPADCMGCLE